MKTVLITGASDGIGEATARALLARRYRVIAHARSEEKANRTAQTLGGDTLSVWGDLSRMAQVVELARQTAERVESLDALVNNAGTIQRERSVTADGFEMTMAINHFAHMLLTLRLQEVLARSAEPRVVTVSSGVVTVSSGAHRMGQLELDDLALSQRWSPTAAYAASKLANTLFAAELAHQPGFEQFISVSVRRQNKAVGNRLGRWRRRHGG